MKPNRITSVAESFSTCFRFNLIELNAWWELTICQKNVWPLDWQADQPITHSPPLRLPDGWDCLDERVFYFVQVCLPFSHSSFGWRNREMEGWLSSLPCDCVIYMCCSWLVYFETAERDCIFSLVFSLPDAFLFAQIGTAVDACACAPAAPNQTQLWAFGSHLIANSSFLVWGLKIRVVELN
jgi:hypothetical protein